MWVGASDTASEGNYVWDSTGKKMVPGYVGWYNGYPVYTCSDGAADCALYNTYATLPAWIDYQCTGKWGGICESQP